MSKESKSQAIALGVILCTVVLSVLAYNCYFVVDFDKPLPAMDPDSQTCGDDIDCRCEPGGVNCGENPLYDCRVCTELSTCGTIGTNDDGDNWYTCEGARQPDCNDSDNAIYPGATEGSNLTDDDCDGTIDEGTIHASGSPRTLDKGPCGDTVPPCDWSGPVAIFSSPNVSVIWESDEDVSVKRLRTMEYQLSGIEQNSNHYLYDGPTGTSTYNMTDAYLASKNGSDLAGVWIDHLGGKKLYFALYSDLASGAPELTCPTWPGGSASCDAYPDTWPDDPATPIVATKNAATTYGVAFVGDVPEMTDVTDVFFTRFNSTTGALNMPSSASGSDFIALGSTEGSSITDRPALVDANAGYVIGWVENGSSIKLVYWDIGSAYDPARIVTYEPAGYSDFRDPVLVANHQSPDQALVYLIFAAEPSGDSQPEVYAVSIDTDSLDPETPDAAFGPVLRISYSQERLSADVSANWWDDAIGIAWSDRRSGRRIFFRRIADLENGSGTLASEEIDLSESDSEFQGQNPTVVAQNNDFDFVVVWSDSSYLYMRQVTSD